MDIMVLQDSVRHPHQFCLLHAGVVFAAGWSQDPGLALQRVLKRRTALSAAHQVLSWKLLLDLMISSRSVWSCLGKVRGNAVARMLI